MVVVEDLWMVADEVLGGLLYGSDGADDDAAQVVYLVLLARVIVDDAVYVALGIELKGGHADELGALLPGEVVAAHQVSQPLGVDGVEDAGLQGQQEVAGGQRYGAAGVALADDDAEGGHIHIAELGNQAGDGVGLVGGIGFLVGVGAGGVHHADDGQAADGVLAGLPGGGAVVRRAPDAHVVRSVLGNEADAPGHAGKVEGELRRQVGAVPLYALHGQVQGPENLLRPWAGGLLRGRHCGGYVGVHLHPPQALQRLRDLLLREQPLDDGRGLPLREQGEVRSQALRVQVELVNE